MATLTVRNIPEDAKLRFRQVAAAHGRSMEEHLRQLVIDSGNDKLKLKQNAEQERIESRVRIDRLIKAARGVGFDPPIDPSFAVDVPEL